MVTEEALKKYNNRKVIYNNILEDAKQKLETLMEKYERINNDPTINMKERRLDVVKNQIASKKHRINNLKEEYELLRPQDEKDVEYRLRQYENFSKEVKEYVPDDLHLCFHGCPIIAAKHIIEDGQISSSVDRIGVSTSYDVEDQVSVTTKNTIETTVQGYSKLHDDLELPAGCIFVINPKDEEEIKSSETSMIIGNVDFKENPERLYSIITTPENIERVSEWIKNIGFDISKVNDYDGFIKEMQLLNERNNKTSVHEKENQNEFKEKYKVNVDNSHLININNEDNSIEINKEDKVEDKEF